MLLEVSDRSFKSDLRKRIVVICTGLFGCVEAGILAFRFLNNVEESPEQTLIPLAGTAVMFGIAGVLLLRMDTIRTRRQAGERVGLMSRLLFASGVWTALIWLIGLTIVGFPLAIWLGMTMAG